MGSIVHTVRGTYPNVCIIVFGKHLVISVSHILHPIIQAGRVRQRTQSPRLFADGTSSHCVSVFRPRCTIDR